MKRIDIIINRSVDEDLISMLEKHNVGKFYTKFVNVNGVGTCGPHMNDSTWPEVNIAYVMYCSDEEAEKIKVAVRELKQYFVAEGIKLFESVITDCI